jgi:hypothetical protein
MHQPPTRASRSERPQPPAPAVDVSELGTTLLRPEIADRYAPRPAPQPPVAPQVQALLAAEHDIASQRRRMEATQLDLQIRHRAEHFTAVVARWRELLHVVRRDPAQAAELEQLERQIMEYSRELAQLRQQWTNCTIAAREHEEAALRLRREHHL